MAYIFKRPNSKYWWVGYTRGGRTVQKSLKVTAKPKAELLLAEYHLQEAKTANPSSKILTLKVTITDLFKEYISNRAHRPRTKEWYEWCKAYFLRYADEKGLELVTDVGIEAIEGFYAHRKDKDKAPGGARSHLRALRAIFGYAVKKGYIHENPAIHVKAEKPTKKLFRDLNFQEIVKLLNTAKKHNKACYPLYATAYYAGLRAGELIYLEPEDIDYNEGYIHVKSKPENSIKDHQERKIPLNAKLRKILKGLRPSGKWLFSTEQGNARHNNLNREIKRMGKLAGISIKGLCLQVLRETFGSHLRKKGVDIALISQYMGHSSIDVTLRHYAHIPLEETHKEIDLL